MYAGDAVAVAIMGPKGRRPPIVYFFSLSVAVADVPASSSCRRGAANSMLAMSSLVP